MLICCIATLMAASRLCAACIWVQAMSAWTDDALVLLPAAGAPAPSALPPSPPSTGAPSQQPQRARTLQGFLERQSELRRLRPGHGSSPAIYVPPSVRPTGRGGG